MFRIHLLFILLFFFSCSHRLIEKERLREINAYYDEKIFLLKEDVRLSPEEIWKKGTQVRIYVESTPSLLKLKFYPANESRENSVGKLAAYIINENVKKLKYEFEDVDAWVMDKFQVYEPKDKKTKK
ncbi:type II secretion system-associated lipoprotein [Leptospira ilyithenensis]|uniref:Type II secretion system-associated lipoprotein n=1 Tax=Leptospira ilyithenensis TaxID=2484901 RepID=A0A4R9LQL7_9LEPT|nr:type II secretion system-associated lipoprotein [Leptospira ilyithenensis]TGN08270.1 type II secretion system-associated lipoprotein [Leptospira ilyithenensis]